MDNTYREQTAFPDHIPDRNGPHYFRCGFSTCGFTGRVYLNYFDHVSRHHRCNVCSKYCSDLQRHACDRVQEGGHVSYATEFYTEVTRTHDATMLEFQHEFQDDIADAARVFDITERPTENLVAEILRDYNSLIMRYTIVCVMSRDVNFRNGFTYKRYARIYFPSPPLDIFSAQETANILTMQAAGILEDISSWLSNGSGWRVEKCESVMLEFSELQLLSKAQPGNWLPFPFPGRKGFVNIIKTKGKCFHYSVACAINYKKELIANKLRPKGKKKTLTYSCTWDQYLPQFDFSMLADHINIHGEDFRQFECINKINISVFSHHADKIVLVRKSRFQFQRKINLFLIHNGSDARNHAESHFCVIYDLCKLMAKESTTKHRLHICPLCFRRLPSEIRLIEHQEFCGTEVKAKIKPSREGAQVKFSSWYMRVPYPYVCAYSFQYYSIPVDEFTSHKVYINSKQEPCSFTIAVYQNYPSVQLLYDRHYAGAEVLQRFWECVGEISQDVLTRVRTKSSRIIMTEEDKLRHAQAKACEICHAEFTVSPRFGIDPATGKKYRNVIKCADHCHSTERTHAAFNYRYACCLNCNNLLRLKHECVFINFSDHAADNFFVLKGLATTNIDSTDVEILAKNPQEFIQLKVFLRDRAIPPVKLSDEIDCNLKCGRRYPRARFINAAKFFATDRDSTIENLILDNDPNLGMLQQGLNLLLPSTTDGYSWQDLLSLNQFPYSALSSPESLENKLPQRDAFTHPITGRECSTEEYTDLMRVCDKLQIRTLYDYNRMFNLRESLLVAATWASFSGNAIQNFKLDPACSVSMYSYAWEAMLFGTESVFDLFTCAKMNELLQDIRGGLVHHSVKMESSNQPSLSNYNDQKQLSLLFSADICGLYGHILQSCDLPTGGYRWLSEEEIAGLFDRLGDPDLNTKLGYGIILQCSLKYGTEAQSTTMDVPLAPERKTVSLQDLPEYQQAAILQQRSEGRNVLKNKRLLLTHADKENYICDQRMLAYYLSRGMTLAAVPTKAIAYNFGKPIAKFIEHCNSLRQEATTQSARLQYKGMINAIYGVSGRSAENCMKVRLCGSRHRALDYIRQADYAGYRHITDNLSLVFHRRRSVAVNKPRAIAFCVSDLSKLYVYQQIHQLMPSMLPSHKVLSIDTDGWVAEVTGMEEERVWDLLQENAKNFDFSPLSTSSGLLQKYPHLQNLNKGVLGKIKIENFVQSCVVIRPKLCSMKYLESNGTQGEENKCSGIKKYCAAGLCHEDYVNAVLQDQNMTVNQRSIQCVNDQVYITTTKKNVFQNLCVSRVFPIKERLDLSFPIGCFELARYEAGNV